jgi:hypothetical protein
MTSPPPEGPLNISPYSLAIALVLTGCGEEKVQDTANLSTNGSSTTSGTPSSTTGQDQSIQDILNTKCSPCHIGGSQGGGLALDDGHSALVGVPSDQVPSMSFVEPGSRDDSYLWRKLQGTYMELGGIGDAMPITGELSAGQMEQIGSWIDEGAPEG